jgi:hypothetical protein
MTSIAVSRYEKAPQRERVRGLISANEDVSLGILAFFKVVASAPNRSTGAVCAAHKIARTAAKSKGWRPERPCVADLDQKDRFTAASTSSGATGTSLVSTSFPASVISTSSSMRTPMPR